VTANLPPNEIMLIVAVDGANVSQGDCLFSQKQCVEDSCGMAQLGILQSVSGKRGKQLVVMGRRSLAREENQGIGAQILGIYGCSLRQRMIGSHESPNRRRQGRAYVKAVSGKWVAQKSEVDLAAPELFELSGRMTLDDLHAQ
jgi:hypothetical protein